MTQFEEMMASVNDWSTMIQQYHTLVKFVQERELVEEFINYKSEQQLKEKSVNV